jgi:hypothetical protein
MLNNPKIFITIFFIITLLQSTLSRAELLLNGNAFLYGDNIEVGIGPDGAFGSNVESPRGKSKGKLLGYISDPSGNKFQNGYHGDFFLPGFPEEGWGVRVNDKNYNNNSTIESPEIIGNLSNYRTAATSQLVTWTGQVEGLEITQTYRIYNAGISVIIDISLKNTTSTDMTNIYYMRTVDPDNNGEQHNFEHKLDTTNTILYQGGTISGGACVIATQADGSLLELSGYSENSRVSYGGRFNRDPRDVFYGTDRIKNSGSHTADESISIAYQFPEIKVGDTVTFRTGYQLANVPKPIIDIDDDDSSGISGSKYQQTYKLGTAGVSIVDSDSSITGASFTLLAGMSIIINNPHPDDKLSLQGSLPAGISIDNDEENSDTQLYLTGITNIKDYITALQQIRFSNLNMNSNTERRSLAIQIIDEHYTPSQTAESLIDIVIPVTINNDKIAIDDIINNQEQYTVTLTGKAAANNLISIIFTDKIDQKITIKTTANALGDWSTLNSPMDVSLLTDGNIEVLITANSTENTQATLTKTILKDTQLIFSDLLPENGSYLSSASPTFSGKTDPEASVTIKLLNDKDYHTVANTDGIWNISLEKLPLGTEISATISAKDIAGNEKSATRNVKIFSLPLTVNPLDTDINGVSLTTRPTFSGTSQANIKITLRVAITDKADKVCRTTTDSDGNWSCQLPILKSGGPYDCTITATDHEENSTHLIKALVIPILPLIISEPVDNAVISGYDPIFSGTSTSGTTVTVTAATGQTCRATTNAQHHWSCNLSSLSLDASHTIQINNEDAAGNKVTQSIHLTTNKLPLSVQPLGDKNTAANTTPTLIGTSTPGAQIIISVATGETCTTITDSFGNWVCTLPKLPVGGPYGLSISAQDGAGNKTTITQTITIPEIPLVIIHPAGGAVIKTPHLTLSGTTNANTIVTVLGPDGQRCTTRSDDNGIWSCLLENLQTGSSKFITITSGNKLDGEKTILLPVEIANASDIVETIISGGGSSSLVLLLLLNFIILIRRFF